MADSRAIPTDTDIDWTGVAGVSIVENGDPLVPLDLIPERVLVHPVYHLSGVPGARPQCLGRASVMERLVRVAEELPDRLRIVVLDAWRPLAVQQHLYDRLEALLAHHHPNLSGAEIAVRTRAFVAPPSDDPSRPSPHLTGGAVDLTLVDSRGRMLPMGSAFDEVTERSYTGHYETGTADPTIRDNRRLLYRAMRNADFANLPTEWWHFSYGDQLWAWSNGTDRARYGPVEPETMEQAWSRQLRASEYPHDP
ncbi:MAG TPA: M15 family metallopeptidase [Gammaproteobacteria bacterium]|nr:M15 family metallopeptidase [Gammaproteobacteria bacterium]